MTDPKVVELRDPEEYGLVCECGSQSWILLMDHSVRCAECWAHTDLEWESEHEHSPAH